MKKKGDGSARIRDIKTWVNEEEREKIQVDARKAGMTVSSYVRLVLMGASVTEAPDTDVPVLINEVRKVGMSLEKLMERDDEQLMISGDEFREILEQNRRAERMISEAYGTRWRSLPSAHPEGALENT